MFILTNDTDGCWQRREGNWVSTVGPSDSTSCPSQPPGMTHTGNINQASLSSGFHQGWPIREWEKAEVKVFWLPSHFLLDHVLSVAAYLKDSFCQATPFCGYNYHLELLVFLWCTTFCCCQEATECFPVPCKFPYILPIPSHKCYFFSNSLIISFLVWHICYEDPERYSHTEDDLEQERQKRSVPCRNDSKYKSAGKS